MVRSMESCDERLCTRRRQTAGRVENKDGTRVELAQRQLADCLRRHGLHHGGRGRSAVLVEFMVYACPIAAP